MERNEINIQDAILEILQFDRIVALLIGIGFIVVLSKFIRSTSMNLQLKWPSRRLFVLQIATILNFILYIGGTVFLIYAVFQPPKEVLLAVGGSAAVAIGFSLKDIVASLVAGIVLLFDRPFQVGDRVTFGDTYGEIVNIGLRTVKLNTLDDSLVTIPNARFLTDVVSSGNAGELDMMIVINFHIALDADMEKATSIIHEVVATSRFAYLKKQFHVLSKEVIVAERLAILLTAKVYVIDCRFEKDFESDVVRRVLKLFQKHDIKRPPLNLQAKS